MNFEKIRQRLALQKQEEEATAKLIEEQKLLLQKAEEIVRQEEEVKKKKKPKKKETSTQKLSREKREQYLNYLSTRKCEEKSVEKRIEIEEKPVQYEKRSPIVCVLGHVDAGKTSLLDSIRDTKFQKAEAGGITQQIGATFVSSASFGENVLIPGLLFIDTPGHAVFNNLRVRGSELCDIAIVAIDLMHGIEPQTIESIELLRHRKIPFVVALTKCDRCFDWDKTVPLRNQKRDPLNEFISRSNEIVNQLQTLGLNSALYDENPDPKRYVSLVPVSAHTGQGVSDLMKLLIKLTQSLLKRQLELSDKIKGVVMDVKLVEGLGTTLDTILSNGTLRVKDEIAIDGKIVSIKSMFVNDEKIDVVHGSAGVKLVISNSENAKVGSILSSIDEISEIETNYEIKFDLTPRGVALHASTFGSLEALYLLTVSKKIPVRSVNIGTVTKREVLNNLIGDYTDKVIFAFDVDVVDEAEKQANSEDVKIIKGDVIYQILAMYETYIVNKSEEIRKLELKKIETELVWPCELEILNVFNNKAPIILGVRVVNGKVKTHTPLVTETGIEIGKIATIEKNRESISEAIEGDEVAIRIDSNLQFNRKDAKTLYSQLNRKRIDLLKTYFIETLTPNEKKLVVTLKKMQKIN